MLKRCTFSFMMSAMCGLIINMLIEIIVRMVTGMDDFIPISPEYLAMFPSESIAIEVHVLLYGVIGAAFSGMMFVFEYDKLGFVMQNILYFLLTGIIWLPIITIIWQLQRYPSALICTLLGFAVTYVIMSIVGYKITKKDVEQINHFLEQRTV